MPLLALYLSGPLLYAAAIQSPPLTGLDPWMRIANDSVAVAWALFMLWLWRKHTKESDLRYAALAKAQLEAMEHMRETVERAAATNGEGIAAVRRLVEESGALKTVTGELSKAVATCQAMHGR